MCLTKVKILIKSNCIVKDYNFSIVNINLEQNKTLVSICVTRDIKWTIPGSR
jgi:hypothetical protein